MIKRLLIFIFALFVVMNAVNADLTTSIDSYYKFDSGSFADSTGNYVDATNQGTTSTTGIINQGRDLDGTSQWIDLKDHTGAETQKTFNIWYNPDNTGNAEYIVGAYGTGGTNRWYWQRSPTNQLVFATVSGTTHTSSGVTLTNGVWSMLTLHLDSSANKIYMYQNGVIKYNATYNDNFVNGNNWTLGWLQTGGNYDDSQSDEIGIWDRFLTQEELATLYNGGSPNAAQQYPFSISIIDNLKNYYNTENISIELNSSDGSLINMSYKLNNGNYTTVCSNCNNTNLNLTNLADTTYNITFLSVFVGGNSTTQSSFTIDTTNPSLAVVSFSEWNTYTINFSTLINFSDTNLDTCLVTTTQNTSSCTASYTFNFNGNQTFNVSVNDSAGNTATSNNNIVFINPIQRFHFADNGTLLTNFQFGGITFTGDTANFSTFGSILSFGNNTLEFNKVGFGKQNFTFELTNNSNFNITYNVSVATINVFIKDKETFSLVTGHQFNLNFIGATGLNTSTTTGIATTSGLLTAGDYTLITTSADYETESTFFTFNNQEVLNLTVYVTNSSDAQLGFVVIQVLDTDGAPVQNAIVEAKQWVSSQSAYVSVSSGKTSTDGKAELNIILDNQIYKFAATKGTFTSQTVEQIITSANNGKTIIITLDLQATTIPKFNFQNVVASATEDFNTTTNISLVTFTWTNSDGTDLTGCVNAYRIQNYRENRIATNCTTSDAATLITAYTLDLSSYDYIIKAEFLLNGNYYTIASFTHYKTGSLFRLLAEYNFHLFILMLLNVLSIYAGIQLNNMALGTIGLIFSSLISIVIAPTLVTTGVAFFLMFIGVVTLYGGTRP